MKIKNKMKEIFKELSNFKSARVTWQILIYVIIISMIFTCIVKIYNKNEIVTIMKNMYFLDFTESKEKEFILEVVTNPFLEMSKRNNLKQATLHLKDGHILDVLVDEEEKLFRIDSKVSKNIGNKIYKYNATLKNKNEDDLNIEQVIIPNAQE